MRIVKNGDVHVSAPIGMPGYDGCYDSGICNYGYLFWPQIKKLPKGLRISDCFRNFAPLLSESQNTTNMINLFFKVNLTNNHESATTWAVDNKVGILGDGKDIHAVAIDETKQK